MLKTCWFYAWRDFVKKPKQFRALIIVSMLVMMSVNFFLMYLECESVRRVSEYTPSNYHIKLYYLTMAEAEEIERMEEVDCIYTEYVEMNEYGQKGTVLAVRIRLKSAYANQAGSFARSLMSEYDLYELPRYSKYRTDFKMYSDVYNYNYYVETTTPYIVRPSTLMIVGLFSLFLGSSVILLFHEKYERSVREYGTLRALGMRRRDIVIINLMETALVEVVSLIPAVGLSVAAFRGFSQLASDIESDVVYQYVSNIPIGNIIVVFIAVTIGALAGSAITCALSYERSDIELINAQAQNSISFVEKTDPKIDRANSPGLYTRLYLVRMRKRQLLNAISIAVTLPLPLYFLTLAVQVVSEAAIDSIHSLFVIFIAAMLVLASSVLTCMTAAYHIMWRKREFSTFRLIGASKRMIFGLVIPEAIITSILCSLPGGITSFYTYDKITFAEAPVVKSWVAVAGMQHYTMASALFLLFFGAAAALVIIILPNLIGTSFTLLRSLKASIIEAIREVE